MDATTHNPKQCPFDLAATFAEGQALSLGEVAARTRGRGGRPHVRTVERWCRSGRRSAGGEKLPLPSLVVGGRRWVMPLWLGWWQRQLAGG